MLIKTLKVAGAAVLTGALLAGCTGRTSDNGGNNGNSNAGTDANKPPEPVELVVYYYGGSYGEERFMQSYGNDIVKKYPHMELKFMQGSTGGGTEGLPLADAIATKMPIDVMYGSVEQIPESLIRYDLAYDHGELIKKNRYDLSHLNANVVAAHKSITGGPIYGLPVGADVLKFLYNRDLFDKFGVPYPKDGMTWDEVYELAKRLSRTDNGIRYRGAAISFEYVSRLNQFGVGFVDPQTSKPLFTTDDRWKRLAELFSRFYQIPGNEVDSKTVSFGSQHTAFTTGGTVAMDFTLNVLNDLWTVNWDLAKFPVFPGNPAGSGRSGGNFFAVTSISKNKDEAFKLTSYLTSREYQLKHSALGTMGVLNDPEMKTIYGRDVPWMQERKINLEALFPEAYAEQYPITTYDKIARDEFVKQMNGLVTGAVTDVNTALRDAAESAAKLIETAKTQTK
ncbi:ABC transporter substrate-binding protein [Paenibacillus oceani]|uniref:Extracellular solute-binding protein n=1 Tax=Paenibacillus oceani TaxID=2772510 RepID=A0A927CAB9_9BACL|nr:extracellular solute-binding protein [Paenibacillus oceani]MBD2864359.1 extracellular solute-binding protein [Paenibacillus oceani]